MNRLPLNQRKPLPLGTVVKDPSGQGWRIGAIRFADGERTYMTVLEGDERCVSLFGRELEDWYDENN